MTEHDDVLDLLRSARPEELPEELVSPHAPAAQALLEEILSMQTIEPETESPAETVDIRRPRRRRRFAFAGVAAAAVAAAVAAVTVVVEPIETSVAAAIDAALARSASSLAESGRAEVTWRTVYGGDLVENGVDSWEYSGEDTSVSIQYVSEGEDAIPGDTDPINRYVDGELYLYLADRDGQYRWFHDINGDLSTYDRMQVTPDTLLEKMRPSGDFEEVGNDTVDGVTTRRLRAENPGDTPVLPLGATMSHLGEVVTLEVWVDDDGLVRRLDLAFAGGGKNSTVTEATVSVRFYDFGEPIIEAPPDAEDIDPVG